jgi:hypothetical protein
MNGASARWKALMAGGALPCGGNSRSRIKEHEQWVAQAVVFGFA